MIRKISIKRFVSLIITISVIAIIFLITYYETMPRVKSSKVIDGKLDLSDWNFKNKGIVFLNGEWNFYPEKLLEPKDIIEPSQYIMNVPGNWGLQKYNVQSAKGSGTYHISITLPKQKEELFLKVQNIWMSHRLFINGVLVKEMGKPNYTYEGNQSKNTPYLIRIGDTDKLDIVIQVTNYMYYDGGIIHPLQLGNEKDMEMRYMLSFGTDMAGFFLLLLFGIYHLNMYQMRDRESTYLFSGIYLILLSFGVITTGEKIFMKVFENIPFQIAYKFQDISNFFSFPVLFLFIHSLEPNIIGKRVLKLVILPIILYSFMIIFTPYSFYINVKYIMSIYTDIMLLIFVVRLIYILLQRKDNSLPKDEFVYIIASISFITAMICDAAFYHLGYVNTNLIGKVSLSAFLLSLNLLLARRFTNKMNEVQTLSENLKTANEIKDEFLVRTSHELKNPLEGIANISTHLLKDNNFYLTVEQRNNVNLINDISLRLSLLVNDLIDTVKLKHGDINVNTGNVDLYVLIEVVYKILSFDIYGKKLKLINHVKPMTFITADENRVKQILYNVIDNAIKYTEAGKIIASAEEKEENIILTISDTGKGIPYDRWKVIFKDPYKDVNSEAEEKSEAGLGLYISKELAKLMDGDVWVSSSVVGQGTYISIMFPKGYEEVFLINDIAKNIEIKAKVEESNRIDKNKTLKKILIVDDEHINIKILSMILEKEFEVFEAYKGDSALEILQNNKIDLVITDIMMAGMSGIELIQRIRNTYSIIDLPILVSTTKYSDNDIELAYQVGADDYITKPFSEELVLSRVRILLKLTEAVDKALKSEIAFLQAQIKPHFIYNALSNIIAICYEDGERAAELLALLSRYLRHIFKTDQAKQMIPIKHELDLINAYVEIEKLRLGDRFIYKTYIDPAIYEDKFKIPALIIQPLLENAIRHGIFNKEGIGTVTLSITEGEQFISIIVEDDGIGMSDDEVYRILQCEKDNGVGIRNIKRRVKAIDNASFSIESELEKGTRCRLFLPKEIT
jgi:sensor histidine kinase YesM